MQIKRQRYSQFKDIQLTELRMSLQYQTKRFVRSAGLL